MKKYVIIAGVNGAGKSTLYQSLCSLKNMDRVNTDEIVRETGCWKNPSDLMYAGMTAVRKIHKNFQKGISFNQETTLCGQSVIKNIGKAKSLGYVVEIHYVGVDSAGTAKERVHNRVLKGGHGIPDVDIERRYKESFVQLGRIMDQADILAVYDNTESFRRFAIYRRGKLVKMSHKVPDWFTENVAAGDIKHST